MAPTVDWDIDPVWSLDGKRVAYVRVQSEARDEAERHYSEPDRTRAWTIWVADPETGSARQIWHSGTSLQSSYPEMAEDTGGGVLELAAENHIVFASEEDGWQYLYAISADGGATKLLTPGNCEAEQWSFSDDRREILFNSNCGDVDRRHLWRVGITESVPEAITQATALNGAE